MEEYKRKRPIYKGEELFINNEFLKTRPLSQGKMVKFRKSPKHYIDCLVNPKEATKIMIVGNAIDCLSLSGKKVFEKRYEVWKKATGTGSKAINEASLADAKENKITLLTSEQMENVNNAVESLYDDDMARSLLEKKKNVQKKLSWIDRKNKIPMIGYLDFESVYKDQQCIVDLKAPGDADPNKWIRTSFFGDMENIIQAGTYLEAYKMMYFQFPLMFFVCVEQTAPYAVAVNFVDNKVKDLAKYEYDNTLMAFRYCMENDLFHMGYAFRLMGTKDYNRIDVPGFYKTKYDGFETIGNTDIK